MWTPESVVQKIKLFLGFVDFSKADDKVTRQTLYGNERFVCRAVGVAAVMAYRPMHRTTDSITGYVVLAASQGLRQGSHTSCFLFVMFVNVMIRCVKEKCRPESFNEWLQILMFMDDTVLLAVLLKEYCNEYSMRVNNAKTKNFVISGITSLALFPLRHWIIARWASLPLLVSTPLVETPALTRYLTRSLQPTQKRCEFCGACSTLNQSPLRSWSVTSFRGIEGRALQTSRIRKPFEYGYVLIIVLLIGCIWW